MILKLLNNVIDLFYPKICLLCKKTLVEGEEHLCMDCMCNLPKTNYHKQKKNPAKELFAGFSNIVDVSAFLFFEKEGATQAIVHAIKYYGNKNLARYAGRLAALELYPSEIFSTVDVIIAVPLHRKKERKRGFNQSEYISLGMAEVYNKSIDNKSLIRKVYTKSQTRKNIYERHVNVENIFKVVDIESLTGKHILIVDDVITTGATTSACIEALFVVPDVKISVFSLAIAGKGL